MRPRVRGGRKRGLTNCSAWSKDEMSVDESFTRAFFMVPYTFLPPFSTVNTRTVTFAPTRNLLFGSFTCGAEPVHQGCMGGRAVKWSNRCICELVGVHEDTRIMAKID